MPLLDEELPEELEDPPEELPPDELPLEVPPEELPLEEPPEELEDPPEELDEMSSSSSPFEVSSCPLHASKTKRVEAENQENQRCMCLPFAWKTRPWPACRVATAKSEGVQCPCGKRFECAGAVRCFLWIKC